MFLLTVSEKLFVGYYSFSFKLLLKYLIVDSPDPKSHKCLRLLRKDAHDNPNFEGKNYAYNYASILLSSVLYEKKLQEPGRVGRGQKSKTT